LFLKNIIISCLRLCDYSELEYHFEQTKILLQNYTLNWYYNSVLYLIYLLRIDQFVKASEVYVEVTSSKNFKTLPKIYHEYFNILAAYISIADSEFELKIGRTFSPYKFINDVPKFSKEKSNSNISILIAHFILLIKEKKYNSAIDRVDALKQYSYRYLKRDITYRSNCFIKLMIEITNADFNRIRTERYTKNLINKLNLIPQRISKQSIDIEYINYNTLWNIILKYLK
jgi:hypothetical protein